MSTVATTADFEAEGLLDDVSGEAREARERLLTELLEAGVELEELRAAVTEDRLALIPVEHALAGDERYSANEIADLSGVDPELLERQWRALGMVVGDRDARYLTGDDLEGARRVRAFLDAGLDPERMLESARVMAMAMSQVAAASRQMVGQLFDGETDDEAAAGANELEAARLYEGIATALVPMVGPTLEHIYKLQLREQLRHAAVNAGTDEEASVGDEGDRMAIGFADLVGFTRLGEQLSAEEFGAISTRFGELASEVAKGPVRLVKLIGDAAMLAAPDPGTLLGTTLDLLDAVEEEGGSFPGLRGGVSFGHVLPRSGDLYGRTVNLASRITTIARPGSVLVADTVRDRLEGEFRFSDAGHKTLKGIGGAVKVYRARDLDEEEGEEVANGGARRRGRRRRRRRR